MIYIQTPKVNRTWSISDFSSLCINKQKILLNKINVYLESVNTQDRIKWAIQYLPQQLMLSSSFGAQSIVSLHLITGLYPNIPVVLIDTGYLFPETYRFIDHLTEKMKLNLYVFRANQSSAWQEAKYGKLWKQGVMGINKYNFINKVEPMRYALKKLKIATWFAGLRRSHSDSRKNLSVLSIQDRIFKFLPIIDWSNQQMNYYMHQYGLTYHPLWYQGYVSIGDVHTTRKKDSGMKDEDTRFFGLKRECGLHQLD